MRIVTDREKVLKIYERCAEAGVAVVAACCESTGELEGFLTAAEAYAEEHGIERIPINIGFTGVYPENAQLLKVSTGCRLSDGGNTLDGGDVVEGFEIMMGHLETYAALEGCCGAVDVLPFLDHGMPTDPVESKEILENPKRVERLAVVMFDASHFSFDENVKRTAEYAEKFGDCVVVEGAVDRIYEREEARKAGITRDQMLTTPERAADYLKRTGVDFIVPNLGTEHRVTSEEGYTKNYEKDRAQRITEKVGRKQVLHGTSCLGREITTLADDGIIKVNIYTRIAVESGVAVYSDLKANEKMVLKDRNLAINSPSYRNEVHRLEVAKVTRDYFDAFKYPRLAEAGK